MRAAANAGEEDTSKGLATRVAVVCEVQGRAGLREDKMHHMDVKLKTHTCSQGEPGKNVKQRLSNALLVSVGIRRVTVCTTYLHMLHSPISRPISTTSVTDWVWDLHALYTYDGVNVLNTLHM